MASAKRLFSNFGAGLKRLFTPEQEHSVHCDRSSKVNMQNLPVLNENKSPNLIQENERSVFPMNSSEMRSISKQKHTITVNSENSGPSYTTVEHESRPCSTMFSDPMTRNVSHSESEFSLKFPPILQEARTILSPDDLASSSYTNMSTNNQNPLKLNKISESPPSASFNHGALSTQSSRGHVITDEQFGLPGGTEREFAGKFGAKEIIISEQITRHGVSKTTEQSECFSSESQMPQYQIWSTNDDTYDRANSDNKSEELLYTPDYNTGCVYQGSRQINPTIIIGERNENSSFSKNQSTVGTGGMEQGNQENVDYLHYRNLHMRNRDNARSFSSIQDFGHNFEDNLKQDVTNLENNHHKRNNNGFQMPLNSPQVSEPEFRKLGYNQQYCGNISQNANDTYGVPTPSSKNYFPEIPARVNVNPATFRKSSIYGDVPPFQRGDIYMQNETRKPKENYAFRNSYGAVSAGPYDANSDNFCQQRQYSVSENGRFSPREQTMPNEHFDNFPSNIALRQNFNSYTPFRARKEKEPDKFDGRTTEWTDYISHFEQVARWNRWSEEEKASQLAMSLRGNAQRVLSELTQFQLADYNILRRSLTQIFCPAERESAYRCEFRSRRRQRDEPASDYGYSLKRLASYAFPTIPASMRETLVIEQFITGLGNVEIKRYVQFKHPSSLDHAISLVVEYEAFEGTQNFSRKPIDKECSGVRALQSKYRRHWEEKHVRTNFRFHCPVAHCQASCKRTYDMKSHIFKRHDKHPGRVEEIMKKCQKDVVDNIGFIDPGFFVFKGKTIKVLKEDTRTVISPPQIQTVSTATTTATATFTDSMETSVVNHDSITKNLLESNDSTTTASVASITASASTQTEQCPSLSIHTASQTSSLSFPVIDFPEVPDGVDELERYVVYVTTYIDKLRCYKQAAKEKIERLQAKYNWRAEKEKRRELEKENRALRKQIIEMEHKDRNITFGFGDINEVSRDERVDIKNKDGEVIVYKRLRTAAASNPEEVIKSMKKIKISYD